jgi:ergothioneine biosynthesis protein EgtB
MSGAEVAERLLPRLRRAWERSDALFALLEPESFGERPIALRQPFIFYLGHLPAFAWNQVGRAALRRPSFRPDFDELFERGIDPVGVDAYEPEAAPRWPAVESVLEYRDHVRGCLAQTLAGAGPGGASAVAMTLEHELMHHETLLYMLQQLAFERKRRPPGLPILPAGPGARAGPVEVPAGRVTLGARRESLAFGWDNEFPEHEVEVGGFTMDRTAVRNREYLVFVEAGGYRDRRLWRHEDWAWRQRRELDHPLSWRVREGRFACVTLFEEVPLEAAGDWPVYVSWAEAAAFARWRGARLPSEAEYHRAAYGTPDGETRAHPWGGDPPAAAHGNFDLRHWSPTPVGSFPQGASAWGVLGLVGNGWEWTSSLFAPLPGFEPLPTYPGYSRDFFDGRHYVLLGASWATDAGLVRRSFRNWFQPHYPYVFAKFRCVSSRSEGERTNH